MTTTQIHATKIGNLVVVGVDGPIRAGDSESAFLEAMNGLLRGGDIDAVLDLSAVPHVDSTGLGRILQAVCRFERAGGTLRLFRPSAYVTNLLAITKVRAMVEVVESLDEVAETEPDERCYGTA